MWIFTNESFLSVVAHKQFDDCLLVRGRFKGDIEAAFPGAEVEETPEADYRFRAVLPRLAVANYIQKQVKMIDYPNFKGSIECPSRHDIYMNVWGLLESAQRRSRGILKNLRRAFLFDPADI
jgi:hypothetical protein